MKWPFIPIAVAFFILCGCSISRLDQGIIELNTKQSVFIEGWGLPDRQYTASGDSIVSAGWGGRGGSFFSGKRLYDIWVYESRKTELAFYDKRLAGYDSKLTRQQLQDSFAGEKKKAAQ